jgi:hypothetical protein
MYQLELLAEYKGTGSTGLKGRGPVYREISDKIDQINNIIDEL